MLILALQSLERGRYKPAGSPKSHHKHRNDATVRHLLLIAFTSKYFKYCAKYLKNPNDSRYPLQFSGCCCRIVSTLFLA